MYNHNKAQQSKNRVHISWDILYSLTATLVFEELSWNINEPRSEIALVIVI